MFHREVWAFICLSTGLLVGAIYVGLPSRLVPLAANEPTVASESESVSEAAIASMRRFAQTAAGLVAPPVTAPQVVPQVINASGTASVPADASTSSRQAVAYNVPLTTLKPADSDASAAMTRDIQAELQRHGCYRGPMDGRWSASVKSAVSAFNSRANAVLPMDGPDFSLLNLARSLSTPVCMVTVATTAPAGVARAPAAPATASQAKVPSVAAAPVTASSVAGSASAAAAAPAAATSAAPAEVTTVRLPAQTAPVTPGAIATVPTPANTRMSLGVANAPAAAAAPPVTTAVVGAPPPTATAAPQAAATPPEFFLHPLGTQ